MSLEWPSLQTKARISWTPEWRLELVNLCDCYRQQNKTYKEAYIKFCEIHNLDVKQYRAVGKELERLRKEWKKKSDGEFTTFLESIIFDPLPEQDFSATNIPEHARTAHSMPGNPAPDAIRTNTEANLISNAPLPLIMDNNALDTHHLHAFNSSDVDMVNIPHTLGDHTSPTESPGLLQGMSDSPTQSTSSDDSPDSPVSVAEELEGTDFIRFIDQVASKHFCDYEFLGSKWFLPWWEDGSNQPSEGELEDMMTQIGDAAETQLMTKAHGWLEATVANIRNKYADIYPDFQIYHENYDVNFTLEDLGTWAEKMMRSPFGRAKISLRWVRGRIEKIEQAKALREGRSQVEDTIVPLRLPASLRHAESHAGCKRPWNTMKQPLTAKPTQ